jgi:antitoxin component YwqK of YwqJK toxin-antitoxin module
MNQLNENSQRHGLWVEYYNNGKIHSEHNYLNNERHGVCKDYHENGVLWIDAVYNNGYRVTWSRYFEDGSLDTFELYGKKGLYYFKTFNQSGDIIQRSHWFYL